MCGLFGIVNESNVSKSLIKGLRFLQHRGQDAAGLYTLNSSLETDFLYKNLGLINQAFADFPSPCITQTWGLAHVRYATTGVGSVTEAQPLKKERTAIAHNGNIINYLLLKRKFEEQGHVFQSKSDAEIFLHYFSNFPSSATSFDNIEKIVRRIFSEVLGSYSVILLIKGIGMVVFRDPKGLRPLLMGVKNDNKTICFSSESYPLTVNGFNNIVDIKPAELILVDKNKNISSKVLIKETKSICSFELNYFASPTSWIEKKEVYRVRAQLGKYLALNILKKKIMADVVVSVPESGNPAALSLGYSLQLPVEAGLIKQSNIGRTFITSNQFVRESLAAKKWAVVESVFKNKRVILVDDSIVRGTISKKAVELAKKAGARKVFFASTYPPIRYPCFYGIDFPEKKQLIASNLSNAEIAERIGADDVIFNDISDLSKAININGICTACLNGRYPTKTYGKDAFQKQRLSDLKAQTKSY